KSYQLYSQYIKIYHFFFSSRRRHTRFSRDWSSDVCSSDLLALSDVGKLVVLDNSSPITLSIPDESTVSWPAGAQIDIVQWGDGRSEERRVGKGCRARWSRERWKTKSWVIT